MKTTVMLFSSNGSMLRKIEREDIKEEYGRNLKVGESGEIIERNYVLFSKKDVDSENAIKLKETFADLEIYVFDTCVFKGKGLYNDGSGHSKPSVTAWIEGEFLKISFSGILYKNMTVLINCE